MVTDHLFFAGEVVRNAEDRLRRYCGLPWSGGDPETWAYRYYDTLLDASPNTLLPVDVLAAAALHPGLSRADLDWYSRNAARIEAWLTSTDNYELAPSNHEQVVRLVDLADGTNFGLLTKVLHRKRPRMVPIAERGLVDWYRRVTGERSAVAAWPMLISRLAEDLNVPHNRSTLSDALRSLNAELPTPLSPVRAVDICIWMDGK